MILKIGVICICEEKNKDSLIRQNNLNFRKARKFKEKINGKDFSLC